MENEPILPVPQYKRMFDKLNEDMMDAYKYAFFNKLPEPTSIWTIPGKMWTLPQSTDIETPNMQFDSRVGRLIGYDDNGMAQVIIGNIEGEKMSAKPMSPVIEKLVELSEKSGRLSERVNHQGEHLRQDQDVIEELQSKVHRLTTDMNYVVRERDDYKKAYYEVRNELNKIHTKELRAKARKAAAAKKAKKTVKKSK